MRLKASRAHAYASDPEVTRFMFFAPRSRDETRDYLERMRLTQQQMPRTVWELAVVRAAMSTIVLRRVSSSTPRRAAERGWTGTSVRVIDGGRRFSTRFSAPTGSPVERDRISRVVRVPGGVMMMRRLGVLTLVVGALAAGTALALQQPAKKAYIVVQVEVTNPQQYGEYTKLSPAIIEKFGGHFLARGGRVATLEGPPARSRVVVIEFPSFERAKQFYDSPEYVAARKVRAGAADAQFVLVEGQ